MENNSLNKDEGILYISFNHDHSCFTIGTEIGFKIYNDNSCFVIGTEIGFKIFNSFPLGLKKERSKNIK